ncbi:ROK family protein [Streptacidiphilus pinicola]|uniref:ROK family protein n=1 Tax=Streptacidiphilus pinicola TaxID=2219663 RepID=A0A2X0IDS7_9ACTN|nr:ROK family protein [Streptacidiphilus pinicola]RAG81773.1 ROK family protein [Streptacidiphilus pinicola]
MTRTADEVVLALDAGGSRIRAAVLGPDASVLHRASAATGAERGPDAVVEALLELAAGLAAQYRPVAAGIAVPGIIDQAAGICTFAANLGWREVPIRQWAAEELGIPVVLGHDVRAAALAEARLGAGRGCRSFLYVRMGTGIAAALVLDGRILVGGHGSAGELGHLTVRPRGRLCACGKRGCLETVASDPALAGAYSRATGEEVGAEEMWRRAQAGDDVAEWLWDRTVPALADGLAAAVTLFDPRRLVIGGGPAQVGRSCFEPLRAALEKRLAFQTTPEILPAGLGADAGCVGAGLLVLDQRPTPARLGAPPRPRPAARL